MRERPGQLLVASEHRCAALPGHLSLTCRRRARRYSQGCFIGCPTCDTASGRRQTDLCGLGKKQTLTDPKYWSVNRDAEPGSVFDVYKHNPWRAPGSAPVSDACGLAGGDYKRVNGAEAGDYTKTKFAQHGDVGTKVLGPLPGYTPPTYKRGGTAEVTWQIRNNHGGGYQYRIAPLPANFSDLKESDFKPLPFVEDQQAIVFPNGTVHRLSAAQTTFVSEGTLPEGGTWSLIPMPPTLLGPCCIPGTHDTNSTPNHCLSGELGVAACHSGVPPYTDPGAPVRPNNLLFRLNVRERAKTRRWATGELRAVPRNPGLGLLPLRPGRHRRPVEQGLQARPLQEGPAVPRPVPRLRRRRLERLRCQGHRQDPGDPGGRQVHPRLPLRCVQ